EEQKTGATMIRKHVIRASLLRATLMVGAIAWGSAIATEPAMARNGVAAQPVVPDWSGVYFGAYVGGGFGRNPWNDPDGVGLGTTSLSGAIFSVAVGYNCKSATSSWELRAVGASPRSAVTSQPVTGTSQHGFPA